MMHEIDRRAAPVALLLALLLLLPGVAAAQAPNRAGLVVQYPDGSVETWCIAFEGDTISGEDLLARSGLDVLLDPTSGMGVTVCRIEDHGCDYPAEHCFCQCMGGGPCAYWNYFYRDPPEAGDTGTGAWTYSPLGAMLRDVQSGSVEAWVWGDGHTPPADDLTFDAICAAPEPQVTASPTATPTATPTAMAQATAAPADTPPPADTATQPAPAAPLPEPTVTTAAPAATATPAPTPDAVGAGAGSYWAFGLVAAALAAIAIVVHVRRR
ncbi:MAG: hypothetical protein PVG11_06770 [Anaerolineae bacterium]|jgi:hypothetical protein